jgi:hypothetical protein
MEQGSRRAAAQGALSRQLPHAVQTALVAPPNVFFTRPDPRWIIQPADPSNPGIRAALAGQTAARE